MNELQISVNRYDRRFLASIAVDRFKATEVRRYNPSPAVATENREKHEALKALGDDPTIEAVDKVVGSSAYTSLRCSLCATHHVDAGPWVQVAFGNHQKVTLCNNHATALQRLLGRAFLS